MAARATLFYSAMKIYLETNKTPYISIHEDYDVYP